jgi:TolA-binding protein
VNDIEDSDMFKKFIATTALSLMVSLSAISAEIPIDAKLDYNQGIDFYKLGMYERAIESFRSAIKIYPDYVDAYYNLGKSVINVGYYESVVAITPQWNL